MVAIRIPFEYEVHGVRRRNRRPATWTIRETFVADVPEMRASSARPVAWPGRTEGSGLVAEGRFLAPVVAYLYARTAETAPVRLGDASKESLTWDALIDRILEGPACGIVSPPLTLSHARTQPDRAPVKDKSSFVSDPSEIREVETSSRASALAGAMVEARELAIVDGVVHTARLEPCGTYDSGGRIVVDRRDVFGLDREHDADVWTLSQARRHEDFSAVGFPDLSFDERLPADFLRLRRTLCRSIHSVFPAKAKRQEHGSGNLGLVDVPADLDEAVFHLRRSLRALPQDLRTGTIEPDDVTTALERLDVFADRLQAAARGKLAPLAPTARRLLESIEEIASDLASTSSTTGEARP